MRIKIMIVLTGLAIILTAISVFYWRQDKVEQWNGIACTTLKEALNEDLQSRCDLKVEHYGKGGFTSIETKIPRSIFIISERGRREYEIDSCKHIHNIMSDPHMRQITGMVLEERPLVADTINSIWKRLLDKEKIAGQTKVRISVTDLDNHTTSESSAAPRKMACDSLLSCYIGYRCEIEVTGFIHYAWLDNIGIMDGIILSSPLLIMLVLYLGGFFFKDKLSSCFIKKVPVVIEKEVPVIAVEKTVSHIYQLENGLLFDLEDSSLRALGKEPEHLYPQSKLLLKAFLEAENNILSSGDIMSLLWPDGNGTLGKVHQAITRLRSSLTKVSQIVLSNNGYTYHLILPHFIEEN
ncbi:MAG: hypothetical protein ACLUVZ_01955 [Bacteroides stercoris]